MQGPGAGALIYEKLITALAALDSSGALGPARLAKIREMMFYVEFGAATSAGVVLIEGAHDPNYTGTWSVLGTVTWAAATRVHTVAVTGVHLNLRARISTAIVGGTVNVVAVGN